MQMNIPKYLFGIRSYIKPIRAVFPSIRFQSTAPTNSDRPSILNHCKKPSPANFQPIQPINQLNIENLLQIFTNDKSNRMQVCKAGERLLEENVKLSEQQMKDVVNRLFSSRFFNLIYRLSHQFIREKTVLHSGLSKTLIRVASELEDRSFFIHISNHIKPELIQPCGELSGVYLRTIIKLFGYDASMQYFLQCPSHNNHFRVILPEMLFGLYENHFYDECISLYNALCNDYGWEPYPEDGSEDQEVYFKRQRSIKIMKHARIYAAVIGSHLAVGNQDIALALYKEMNFWGVTPLRETYYDLIRAGEQKESTLQLPKDLTDVQKGYLLSLEKCKHYDALLPYVRDHNQYRFSRENKEKPLEQTIEVSVRLTPMCYQRMEVYRLLKEMSSKDRRVWYTGRMIIKVEKECNGVLDLLSKDLQPRINYRLADHDEIHVELASVYNWLDITTQLKQTYVNQIFIVFYQHSH